MTIAQAFNEITVAQGGTASKSGTIAGAIDALNDVLAGSDQPAEQTIEAAVRLLGQHIGGGGGGGNVGNLGNVFLGTTDAVVGGYAYPDSPMQLSSIASGDNILLQAYIEGNPSSHDAYATQIAEGLTVSSEFIPYSDDFDYQETLYKCTISGNYDDGYVYETITQIDGLAQKFMEDENGFKYICFEFRMPALNDGEYLAFACENPD